MTFVVLTGQPWGVAAFSRVERMRGDSWLLVHRTTSQPMPNFEHMVLKGPEVPRYVFLMDWPLRLPSSVVDEVECVDFRCTPLPYGRGGQALENMILRGHEKTTITAHRIVDEIDAGPIYWQSEEVSIGGSRGEIVARFVEPVARMIELISKRKPKPYEQSGPVVCFGRLSMPDVDAIWRKRCQV